MVPKSQVYHADFFIPKISLFWRQIALESGLNIACVIKALEFHKVLGLLKSRIHIQTHS
jgi:hypothetical protein